MIADRAGSTPAVLSPARLSSSNAQHCSIDSLDVSTFRSKDDIPPLPVWVSSLVESHRNESHD